MTRDYSHRKGQKRVRIVRADGSPVIGQAVQYEMTNHEFLWGSAIRETIPYVNSLLAGEQQDDLAQRIAHLNPRRTSTAGMEKEKIEERIAIWMKLFNNTTYPFYWQNFEPEQGKPMTWETLQGAKWLKERGITVKGHPLCWHTLCADWLMQYDNEEILRRQLNRIRRDVGYFAGTIDMWDVINEVVIMPIFDKYDNAMTRVCKEIGRVSLIKQVFDAAKETNPDATLLINDFNLSTNYEILIDGALNAGTPIDVIGLQTHQHQGYMGAERLYEILERFEHFGLPLHFTENTLISGHIMPPDIVDLNDYQIPEWPSTPEGEDRQARETVEMYEIFFSHPLVDNAVSWNFVDGGWLGAPAGFIRQDNSIKPVYDAVYELVKGKWWTRGEAVTDANGEIVVDGFRGDYKISCCGNEATLALRKGKLDGVQVMILD